MDKEVFADSGKLKNIGFGVLVASFIAVCFAPSTLMFTRLENLLLPIVVVVLLASNIIRFQFVFFLALSSFFLFDLVTIFLNGEGIAEVSFAFRTLKILLILILATQIFHEYMAWFNMVIRGVFLLVAMIIFIEALDLFGINENLFKFFTHHSLDDYRRLDSNRIIGTMMNPNNNGVLLTCFCAYFMSAFYYHRKRIDIVFIALSIVLLILAQSRTALIAVVVMAIPFVLSFQITKKTILLILGSVILILFLMYKLELNYMMALLTMNPLEINELRGRFPGWIYMLDAWSEHRILGVGPFADTFNTKAIVAPDSEYLYVLSSRGIIGFLCYVTLLIYPIVLFWNKRREIEHGLLAVLISVAFMIIGITNFSILNVRIGVIYAILIGIPFSYLLYKSEASKLFGAIPGFGSLIKKSR
ncbi:MAG: hypothetical protein COB85_06995 [Bacteroidetes bacterium]|nr:MAG: hypothetical protein COB85_06995 [Bacteroidota bacterium]